MPTRVLIPAGVLGLGFDQTALARGVAAQPDMIPPPQFLDLASVLLAGAMCDSHSDDPWSLQRWFAGRCPDRLRS